MLNANLEEYNVPTVADIGEIVHTPVDVPDPMANSLGAKGIGEPPLIPTAPAIANAVFDAVGIRVREAPLARRRIIAALAQKANQEFGALVTLSDIEHSSLLQERFPALAQAAGLAATPQLRNMATIGGNILQRPRCWYFRKSHFPCWLKGGEGCPARDGENHLHAIFDQSPCVAVHPSDLALALVAHNAEVLLRGSGGERSLPIEQFFASPTDDRRTENVLGADELVIGLRVPVSDMRSVYLKAMDRNVWAFALVGVAVAMRIDGDTVTEARVVLSGVAQTPWRSSAAEAALVGAAADEATWRAAAEAAVENAAPLAHNGYKVALAQSLVRQALAALAAG